MEGKINFLSKSILSFINCEELVKLLNNIGLISKPFQILVTRSVARSNTHTGRQHIGFSLASRTESLCSDLKAGEGPASSVWCTDG